MPTSPDKVLLKAAIDLDAVGLKRALKQGADPNATDTKGRTALMLLGQKLMAMYLAGQYPYVGSSLKQDDIKTSVQALLAAGARVDAVDHEGCTALHNPLYHAFCPSAVEMLLQQGAPVNHAASYGATPAHVCAAHGCIGSLQALSEAGVDWSARAPRFWQPADTCGGCIRQRAGAALSRGRRLQPARAQCARGDGYSFGTGGQTRLGKCRPSSA